ncbi:transporter, CPA2 family [Bacteroidales bacterium 6E]|nr:transporter, CPA2 family [Bacteroidales bacterium 6E]
MILLAALDLSLPLTNPVLKFFVILTVILSAPLILNKLRIPHILGLIIAGAIIGPNGINLLLRDSSIILSGTAGLLYIMFLAGLEIDLNEFRKNSGKSMVFGMYTFWIPMILGIMAGYYILNMSMPASILLASMFASHTLIAYPILGKLGVTRNRAVNITIGGTMITDTLALLVLAVIVGMSAGEVNSAFWIRLAISITVFGLIVMLLFPVLGRWFLKRVDDSISQYIFVLVMVFLGAVLAEAAGIEAIIGAFLAGLALNRLIPSTSPLMNRIEFVGNAVFIPFFLIGVGMLVDYRAFFNDWETIKVATVMTVVATVAKFSAAWLTQKSFRYSVDERRLIFGLSNAQAAATLAAVLVGHGVIIGQTETGEPIRLLSDAILNGTIVMILITCTIATFVAQKGALNISIAESVEKEEESSEIPERILIPVSNPNTFEELINLSSILKSRQNKSGLYALSIMDMESADYSVEKDNKTRKMLEKAAHIASANDLRLNIIKRYDISVENGIRAVIKEQQISDMILGLHEKKAISESFLGRLTEGILHRNNITTFVYKPVQPIATIKRHMVMIPPDAEREIGFTFWLSRIWNIGRNTGTKMVFMGSEDTMDIVQKIHANYPIDADFRLTENWDDFHGLATDFKSDDNLIIVMSRKGKISYNKTMEEIPETLNSKYSRNSVLLVYPMQYGISDYSLIEMNNPSLIEPMERLDVLGKNIARLFSRK